MKLSAKQFMMTAAVSGLLGGTAARLQATPATASPATQTIAKSAGKASMQTLAKSFLDDSKDKHSCKGKNDCKGQGGCKSSANGCKGKNDCKGKGGCATDGSKPPQANV
jgi:hypothetical protein